MRKQDTIELTTSLITDFKELNFTKGNVSIEQQNFIMDTLGYDNVDQIKEENPTVHEIKHPIAEKEKKINQQRELLHNSRRRNQDQEQQEHVENEEVNNCDEIVPRRLMRAINLLVNVKAFYRQLSKNSRISVKLTNQQHAVIGDISSFFKQGFKQNESPLFKFIVSLQRIYRVVMSKFLYFIPPVPVFSPQTLWKRLWDTMHAILIILISFTLSLENFFFLDVVPYITYFHITCFVFVMDILFSFNTAIIQRGNINTKRYDIAVDYMKRNFILDCIGITPIIIQQLNFGQEYTSVSWFLNLLIVSKFVVLSNIIERMAFYLNYQKNKENSVDMVRLLFTIGCVCHFFCILWHGLGLYEVKIGIDQNWLAAQGLVDETSILKRYITSFYFLAVTMITVGYGDITPKNSLEMSFTIVTMFCTGFFYAFSLNKIGSILDNIERKDKSYKESMQIIHGFMREENVSTILRAKISNYLEYLYKESNEVQKNYEKQIMDKLSNQLRNDLILDVQGKYIQNIPILNRLNQMQEIIYIMEECLYSPGEYIFKQGEPDDAALYLLVKGNVQIVTAASESNRQQIILKSIEKSQYFGEISFITGNCRTASAVARDFCRVYKIKRQSFLEVIQKNDQDNENFQMTIESLVMKNNFKFVNIRCYQCGQGDHCSINCPKTHLTFSKQVLINRSNTSKPQLERQAIPRKKQQHYKSPLLTIQQCINAIYEINNNQEYFDILDDIEMGLQLEEFEDSQYDEDQWERDMIQKQLTAHTKKSDEKLHQKSKLSALSSFKARESEQYQERVSQHFQPDSQNETPRSSLYQQEPKETQQKNRKSIFNQSNTNMPSQVFSKSQLYPIRQSIEFQSQFNKTEPSEYNAQSDNQHRSSMGSSDEDSLSKSSEESSNETETLQEESNTVNSLSKKVKGQNKQQKPFPPTLSPPKQQSQSNKTQLYQFLTPLTIKQPSDHVISKSSISKEETNELDISQKDIEEDPKSSKLIKNLAEMNSRKSHSTNLQASHQIPSSNTIIQYEPYSINEQQSNNKPNKQQQGMNQNRQKVNGYDYQSSQTYGRQLSANRDNFKQQSINELKKMMSSTSSYEKAPSKLSSYGKTHTPLSNHMQHLPHLNAGAFNQYLLPNQKMNKRAMRQSVHQMAMIQQFSNQMQFQQNLLSFLSSNKRQQMLPQMTMNNRNSFNRNITQLQQRIGMGNHQQANMDMKKYSYEMSNNPSQQLIQFSPKNAQANMEKKGQIEEQQLQHLQQIVMDQNQLNMLNGAGVDLSQQNNHMLYQYNEGDEEPDSSYFMLQRLDKAKIFIYYYPHYNYNKIIEKIKKEQGMLNSSIKKKRRKTSNDNNTMYQSDTNSNNKSIEQML